MWQVQIIIFTAWERAAIAYIYKEENLVSYKYFVSFSPQKSQFLYGDDNRGASQKPVSASKSGLRILSFQTRKHETSKVKTRGNRNLLQWLQHLANCLLNGNRLLGDNAAEKAKKLILLGFDTARTHLLLALRPFMRERWESIRKGHGNIWRAKHYFWHACKKNVLYRLLPYKS